MHGQNLGKIFLRGIFWECPKKPKELKDFSMWYCILSKVKGGWAST